MNFLGRRILISLVKGDWSAANGLQIFIGGEQMPFARLGLLGLFCFAVIGCGGSDPIDRSTRTSLRTVVVSPDASNLDVHVDGSPLLVNAPYKTSTGFLSLDNGNRTLTVRETGTSTPLVSTTALLQQNQRNTYVVVGKQGSLEALLVPNNTAAPALGQAKINLVHAAPDLGAVDIYITEPGGALDVGSRVATNVAFKSVTGYLTRTSGNMQVRVTSTGTQNVLFDSGTILLQQGQVRTGLIVESGGGGAPYGLILLQDSDT
ncbi:MAG TPA: DUF4397 domain-containing protein [Fimbriimonadaceae bacterium]|nr:DUF4397 domain-containing protein [Fimbriimonadaceae bacterium]